MSVGMQAFEHPLLLSILYHAVSYQLPSFCPSCFWDAGKLGAFKDMDFSPHYEKKKNVDRSVVQDLYINPVYPKYNVYGSIIS